MKALGVGAEFNLMVRRGFDIGYQPRLGRVDDVGVRQEEDGCHVFRCDAHRLGCRIVGIRRRGRREHWNGRVAIPAVDGLIEIRLLRLCRHSRRRSGALRVYNDQRQLGADRKADRLRFQCDPGARTRRDPQ